MSLSSSVITLNQSLIPYSVTVALALDTRSGVRIAISGFRRLKAWKINNILIEKIIINI